MYKYIGESSVLIVLSYSLMITWKHTVADCYGMMSRWRNVGSCGETEEGIIHIIEGGWVDGVQASLSFWQNIDSCAEEALRLSEECQVSTQDSSWSGADRKAILHSFISLANYLSPAGLQFCHKGHMHPDSIESTQLSWVDGVQASLSFWQNIDSCAEEALRL